MGEKADGGMNERVVLRMAREAGLVVDGAGSETVAAYMRFARIVADAERDACVAICEEMVEWGQISTPMGVAAANCAERILARGDE